MSNMRGKTKVLLLLIALLAIPGLATVSHAQTSGGTVEFTTGHTVQGAFLDQYKSVDDPLELYGLPITDAFEGMSASGLTTVQYFSKARFDLTIGPDCKEQTAVANLGELMYPGPGPLADVPTDGPTCRRFDSTGKSVCYAFLQYYDTHNGADNFGDPISDLEVREGRYVQYFEKVRMEWQPERDADSHVVLTDLGKRYFDLVVGDDSLLEPAGSAAPGEPRQPRAYAFVTKSLISANQQQTLYVVVYDLYRKPVADAQIWVYVSDPTGNVTSYRAPDSDANGISVFSFTSGTHNPNDVLEVEVQISAAGEKTSAKTWFRIWY